MFILGEKKKGGGGAGALVKDVSNKFSRELCCCYPVHARRANCGLYMFNTEVFELSAHTLKCKERSRQQTV